MPENIQVYCEVSDKSFMWGCRATGVLLGDSPVEYKLSRLPLHKQQAQLSEINRHEERAL